MKVHVVIAGCLGLVMWSMCAQAQQFYWARQFEGVNRYDGHCIAIDGAGNVYTSGSFEGTADFDPGPGIFNLTSAGVQDIFITKLGPYGNFIWAKRFGSTGGDIPYSIAVDAGGNVYTTGLFQFTVDFDPGPATFNLSAGGGSDIFITKLDAGGNLIWAKKFGSTNTGGAGYSIAVDAAGNVYTTGEFSGTVDFDPGPGVFNLATTGQFNIDIFIAKLDATGSLIWAKQMGGGANTLDYGTSVAVDTAGNVYVTGYFEDTGDFDPGPATFNLTSAGYDDIFITKLDATGNLLWSKQLGGSAYDKGKSVAVDAAGNIYTTGSFAGTVDFDPGPGTLNLTSWGYDIFIIKLDATGNLVWAKPLGGHGYDDIGYSVTVDAAGNVYATGTFSDTADFDPGLGTLNLNSPGGTDAFIIKLDASGNLMWAKQLSGSLNESGLSIALDTVGNVYTTGYFQGTVDFDPGPVPFNLAAAGTYDVFVLKLSQQTPYVVQGKVFADINSNCNRDTTDLAIPSILLQAEPGPFYGVSDDSGNYIIYLYDTGSYTISPATEDTIWRPTCTTSHNLQFSASDTITGINFAMQAAFYCPRLSVELGVPFLRGCRNSIYAIRYSNTGSLPASSAYIEVDFGAYLQPQSSSFPWSTVSGNVYTFPIGNLPINQQGSFNVTALLDCSAPRGSTQCVTAHIYPDSSCVPPPAGWDKSELRVSGGCINDSLVCFRIKNRSQSGMQGTSQWRLYVNDTLVTRGNYQLAGLDSLIKCYPANGKTYRLEADQRPGYPHNTISKAIVEACGSPANFGFVNTVPQEDAELFVETFCMVVTAAIDPNDKQVCPAGITSNQYITSNDELEYLIRFQNTGTDTAFKVIVRDTIATDVLDIATLTSGASSHEYTFNIYGHGIAEWTFDNPEFSGLPDSNVNEEASHGFVKFKIRQLPGNADGTRIENRAGIYFDFNAPVITNTAWNVVNEADMPESFFTAAIDSVNARCNGDSSGWAIVAAAGGLPPYEYSWSNGETGASVTGLVAGNYSVSVSDAAGTVWTDSTSIAEPAQLTAMIDTSINVLCYANGTGSATASASGGTPPYTYEWSNQGSAFATANFLHAGTYWVTVWDAHLCTATSASITITEPPQLFATVSTQNAVTCSGGNDAAAKTVATGGVPPYGFAWSSGQTSSTATDLSAGDYQVTVTDSNGCELITSVTIQNGYQVNTGAIAGDDTADIGATGTYSVNAGFSYVWSVSNGVIVSGQGTNSVVVDWGTAGQGILQLIATDQGCADTVSKVVAVVEHTGTEDALMDNIELYPNPTNGMMTLRAANISSTVSLKLFDSIGKQVLEQNAEPSLLKQGIILDLKDVKEGVLFLHIKTEAGTRVVKVVRY